ncbi:IS5 family transposase [Streptomyces sp. NPDC058175]|uniref:IS5 family transposase n=1 Tax=Streptomyces sp. NPDC058175 TaxID=3346367 RepID=UPI0036E2A574
MARRELTDDEWELIEPFLPIGRSGPYPEYLRDQFEGVIWKFRSGAQWRDMPPEFGVWQTVYNRFVRWRDAGVFEVLMDGMIAEAARLGRLRGGLTAKVHLASDPRCRPLSFVLTEGQAADSPRFIPVLDEIKVRGPIGRPRTRPDAVAGDKAYSSRANRAHLRKRNIKAVIPEKADQAANRRKKGRQGGRPVSHDAELYKDRNTVERLINKLKAWRGIATRYDKTPQSYPACLQLRGTVISMRSLQ